MSSFFGKPSMCPARTRSQASDFESPDPNLISCQMLRLAIRPKRTVVPHHVVSLQKDHFVMKSVNQPRAVATIIDRCGVASKRHSRERPKVARLSVYALKRVPTSFVP